MKVMNDMDTKPHGEAGREGPGIRSDLRVSIELRAEGGVALELGDHPIADELRSLGLPDATPLLSAWSEHMTGSFGPSTKL